jgi:hypothetical protein
MYRSIMNATVAGILATTAGLALVPNAKAADTSGKASSIQTNEPQEVTVYVLPGAMGLMGPNKKHHDTIAPATFVLRRGVPVTFKVINYDDGMHTIYAPELGLNMTIEPGAQAKNAEGMEKGGPVTPTTTTYTFTPQSPGEFRWQCIVMCDGPDNWAMSDDYDGAGRDGFMAGWIIVL